jgi:hypothetical protein
MKKVLAVFAIIGIMAFSGWVVGGSDSAGTNGSGGEITPAMVVDASFTKKELARFCDAYNLVGYDLGLAAFENGYDESDPPAEEVYLEAVSRCTLSMLRKAAS